MQDPDATQQEISKRFTQRFKNIFRWFIGELIDVLKFDFEGGFPDALKAVLTMINVKMSFNFMGLATEDKLTEQILSVYNAYTEEKKRDLALNEGIEAPDHTDYELYDFEKENPDLPLIGHEEEDK